MNSKSENHEYHEYKPVPDAAGFHKCSRCSLVVYETDMLGEPIILGWTMSTLQNFTGTDKGPVPNCAEVIMHTALE